MPPLPRSPPPDDQLDQLDNNGPPRLTLPTAIKNLARAATLTKRGATSSKSSLTKPKPKGGAKRVKQVKAVAKPPSDSDEVDQLAEDDDEQESKEEKQEANLPAPSSSSSVALERFRFRGPKPSTLQEGLPSTASVPPSSEGTGATSKKRARPPKERDFAFDVDDEAQPSKRRSGSVEARKHKVEEEEGELWFLPEVDENGDPVLLSDTDRRSPSLRPPSQTDLRPIHATSQASLPVSSHSHKTSSPRSNPSPRAYLPSSPFRPAGSASHSTRPSPQAPSGPRSSPFRSSQITSTKHSPVSKNPLEAFRPFPSSIELPSQLATRLRENERLDPAAAANAGSFSPPPRSLFVESSSPDVPLQQQLGDAANTATTANEPVERSSSPARPHSSGPRKSLTDEQQDEVEALIEGLLEEGGGASLLDEEYMETMLGDGGEPGKGGLSIEGAEEMVEGELNLAVSTTSPLALSQLSALSNEDVVDPFPDDLPPPPPRAYKIPSLSPIEQQPTAFRPAPLVASDSVAAAADSTSTFAIDTPPSPAKPPTPPRSVSAARPPALFGFAPRDNCPIRTTFPSATDCDLASNSFDSSSILPLSSVKRSPPQFRLVPVTIDGLNAHLREVIAAASSSSANSSSTASHPSETSTESSLRREITRLTSELLSRDAALSGFSSALQALTASRDAALAREKEWAAKEETWERERERGGLKVEVLREARRGLLGEIEEEREGRRVAEERVGELEREVERLKAKREKGGEEVGEISVSSAGEEGEVEAEEAVEGGGENDG